MEARRIFVDKASGKNFDRPQYQLLRKILGEGDLVYIDALNRMGRNYDEVIAEWKHITRELKADIIVLENESLFDSRKFRDIEETYPKWKNGELTGVIFMEMLELKKNTFYKIMKEYEQDI
ncbi:hypothetical protein J2S09_002673 [Bacillus fengqiuensis]|nr:hypothetical protein [Bacillus fengqiuensis]